MMQGVKIYFCGFVLWVMFLAEPPIIAVSQRVDATNYTHIAADPNIKTPEEVREQENIKQSLFKIAIDNQDTVTKLISKKAKPRIVHVVKRYPIYIPVIPPRDDYTEKDTDSHINIKVEKDTSIVLIAQPIKLENKPAIKEHKHSLLYRLLHKKKH